MKYSNPHFSIVIPCYNEDRFIGQTLEALQLQNYTGSYEIIVVDNNCTDKTVAIAESYGVRVVTESRPGVCWARQAGTEAAKGDIVISTDADTVHSENWLQTIAQSFDTHKGCVAVAGPCAYRDGPWWGKVYPKLLFGAVSLVSKLIGRPFYVTATNIAFKKSAWTRYHTALTQGGDELALLHDLCKEGKVVFDNSNPVHTSGRRLTRGLFYNLFITFIGYYLIAYYVNKFIGKAVIGTAPAYRLLKPKRSQWVLVYRFALVVIAVAVIHFPGHDTLLQQSHETFAAVQHLLRRDRHPSSRAAITKSS